MGNSIAYLKSQFLALRAIEELQIASIVDNADPNEVKAGVCSTDCKLRIVWDEEL